MARLTCVYCNNVISRSDTKCPYCGAETESSIKKFTAVREADIENNKTLLAALNKSRRKQVISLVCATLALVILSALLFKFVPPSTAKTILFVVLVLAYAVCLGVGIKGIRKNSAERRELNARLDGLSLMRAALRRVFSRLPLRSASPMAAPIKESLLWSMNFLPKTTNSGTTSA